MQRGCGWCASAANRRTSGLGGETIACVAMREDPGDEPWVGDFGNDTNGSTTAWTVAEVNLKYPA